MELTWNLYINTKHTSLIMQNNIQPMATSTYVDRKELVRIWSRSLVLVDFWGMAMKTKIMGHFFHFCTLSATLNGIRNVAATYFPYVQIKQA